MGTEFAAHLEALGRGPLLRGEVTTLQLNVGRKCDLACHHCHVEAGPKRTEMIDATAAGRIIELLRANSSIDTLDLTGGAPELSEQFRPLVNGARDLGRRVIDRCNLTVLFEPGQHDTAAYLASRGVEIVASLPCYSLENVEKQRGRGTFGKSIEALRRLNALGYATHGSGLRLDLVYNPQGPALPPDQAELEARYRDELRALFDIEFDALYTITNMPIKRFARQLERTGQSAAYMSLLISHFNPGTVEQLMCRSLLSISYDGQLYDCDFNQALGLETPGREKTLWDLDDLSELAGETIATGPHCFGCTAGSGSSCGGSLA